MSKRSAHLLLEDMLDAVRQIQAYVAGMEFSAFANDRKTCDAVIRNFEIIGEASHRLPDEYKALHPEIDWTKIRGFRNRIVHDYFGIDYEIVWMIAKTNLPQLISSLEKLLKAQDPS